MSRCGASSHAAKRSHLQNRIKLTGASKNSKLVSL